MKYLHRIFGPTPTTTDPTTTDPKSNSQQARNNSSILRDLEADYYGVVPEVYDKVRPPSRDTSSIPGASLSTAPTANISRQAPEVTSISLDHLEETPAVPIIRVRDNNQLCNTQVVTALDLSSSMNKSLRHYIEFFKNGFQKIINNLKPELNNDSWIIGFGGNVVSECQRFYTPNEIYDQIEQFKTATGTPLFRAIEKSLAALRAIKRPNMAQQLHIHTDGADTEKNEVSSAAKEKMRAFLEENPQNKICFYSYINSPLRKTVNGDYATPAYKFDRYGKPTLVELQEKFPLQVTMQIIQENQETAPTSVNTFSSQGNMGVTAEALTKTTQTATLPPIFFNIDQEIPKDFTYSQMHNQTNIFMQSIYYYNLYNDPLFLIHNDFGLTEENFATKSIQLNKRELPNGEKYLLVKAAAVGNTAEIIKIIEKNTP